jgi:hypothetical protein
MAEEAAKQEIRIKRYLYNVYEEFPDPTNPNGCIRRTVWSFESESDAKKIKKFIEIRDVNYPKLGLAKFCYEVDDLAYQHELEKLRERRIKDMEEREARKRVEMDREIRKIKGEVKHTEKELGHLEKVDKKHDKVIAKAKKVMKKKK